MVNFQSVPGYFLSNSTRSANVPVALSRLPSAVCPILAIIWFIATLPCWAIFARHVLGLPLTHAIAVAKIMAIYHSVFSFNLLSAPIAINNLTPPSELNRFAFMATGRRFVQLFKSILLNAKFLVANWACCRVRLPRLVLSRTASVTKPEAGFVARYTTALAFYIASASRALNDNMIFRHGVIIPQKTGKRHIIACENLARQCRAVEISPGYVAVALERYFQAFNIKPELIT